MSMLPAVSKIMERGLVNPPKTLVAFHPVASLDWNAGEAPLGQEDGMAAETPVDLLPVGADELVARLVPAGVERVVPTGVLDAATLDDGAGVGSS